MDSNKRLAQLRAHGTTTALATIVLALCFCNAALADLLVYEGFDYPTTASTTLGGPGDRSLSGVVLDPPATITLANGGGYENPYLLSQVPLISEKWFPININAGGTTYNVAADVDITSGSLSYSGLQASTGNRIEAVGQGYSPRLNFPDVPTTGNVPESNGFNGSVFYSAIIQVNGLSGDPDGDPLISFAALDNLSTGATSAFFAGMFVKPNAATPEDANDYLIGVSKGQSVNGATATYGTAAYQAGSTLFVVGEWEFVANADNAVREANDVARLYINPTTLGGTAAGSGATVVTDVGISADDLPLGSRSIKGIVIHQRDTTVPNYIVDEFRAGTTFADVTPPGGLDGDHNGDGVVDAADYVAWRKLDIDGTQGYDDFFENFGESDDGAGGSGAVPEPTTAVFFGFVGAWLFQARRRFCSSRRGVRAEG